MKKQKKTKKILCALLSTFLAITMAAAPMSVLADTGISSTTSEYDKPLSFTNKYKKEVTYACGEREGLYAITDKLLAIPTKNENINIAKLSNNLHATVNPKNIKPGTTAYELKNELAAIADSNVSPLDDSIRETVNLVSRNSNAVQVNIGSISGGDFSAVIDFKISGVIKLNEKANLYIMNKENDFDYIGNIVKDKDGNYNLPAKKEGTYILTNNKLDVSYVLDGIVPKETTMQVLDTVAKKFVLSNYDYEFDILSELEKAFGNIANAEKAIDIIYSNIIDITADLIIDSMIDSENIDFFTEIIQNPEYFIKFMNELFVEVISGAWEAQNY